MTIAQQGERGYRLDALLDELVSAGWQGQFDARERDALSKLGYEPRASVVAEIRVAVENLPVLGSTLGWNHLRREDVRRVLELAVNTARSEPSELSSEPSTDPDRA